MSSAYASNQPRNQDHPKGWRDILPVHPAADLFPLMGNDELRELADDIAKHGLREKVDLYFDRDGKCFLLDGRNRVAALVLLRKELFDDKARLRQEFHSCPPPKVYSEEDCIAYVISKNIHRRHLTTEQKRSLIDKLLKANPEKSNRQISDQVKASHHTVSAVRAKLESTGQIAQLKKTKGKDGKSRPAKRNQALTKADYSIGENGRLSLPDKLPVPKQATEKVAGSLNGSHPTPKVGAKSTTPTASNKSEASAKALSEFKFGCDHWLPKMTPKHQSEAIKFAAGLVSL